MHSLRTRAVCVCVCVCSQVMEMTGQTTGPTPEASLPIATLSLLLQLLR